MGFLLSCGWSGNVPLERVPYDDELLVLPDGARVKVRHVISAAREGLAGIVLAWRIPVR
jgi:hypothetical protein